MRKVFIHTNDKQLFGARLASFALQKNMSEETPIEIINIDDLLLFKEFKGMRYKRDGAWVMHDPLDLQSFTLARFMAPERMGYKGIAIMMDPDIFAYGDIADLFSVDRGSARVLCCRKKDAWDTSVMVIDCARCTDWNMKELLHKLRNESLDYRSLMTLKNMGSVGELPREWNMLDAITPETRMVHMTQRVTQPWKTGLPIDFTIANKKWYWELLGRYPLRYKEHPDKTIRTFFFRIAKEAFLQGAITETFIKEEIARGHIRPDIMRVIAQEND